MSSTGGIPEAPPVLHGERVHRIHWVLGTDRLRAVCHCGDARLFEDPVELWEWLLAHPDGHSAPDPLPSPPPQRPRTPARAPVAAPVWPIRKDPIRKDPIRKDPIRKDTVSGGEAATTVTVSRGIWPRSPLIIPPRQQHVDSATCEVPDPR